MPQQPLAQVLRFLAAAECSAGEVPARQPAQQRLTCGSVSGPATTVTPGLIIFM